MEPLALTAFLAIAIFALFRTPGVFAPALAGPEQSAYWPGTVKDEDEELPQTDRAPSFQWLPYAVAAVATVRLAFLVALQA